MKWISCRLLSLDFAAARMLLKITSQFTRLDITSAQSNTSTKIIPVVFTGRILHGPFSKLHFVLELHRLLPEPNGCNPSRTPSTSRDFEKVENTKRSLHTWVYERDHVISKNPADWLCSHTLLLARDRFSLLLPSLMCVQGEGTRLVNAQNKY